MAGDCVDPGQRGGVGGQSRAGGAQEMGLGVERECCQPTMLMEKMSVGLGAMSLLGGFLGPPH